MGEGAAQENRSRHKHGSLAAMLNDLQPDILK
jgi:hypothetical protein